MRTLLVLSFLFGGLLQAEEAQFLMHSPEPAPNRTLWRASVTTLAVANTLDSHSSWGKPELNNLLAGPQHTFGSRGTLVKLAFQGSLLGAEYLITRGHPSGRIYRALAFINFGASAAITSVAVHNYTMARLPR
jgi:hypothetical protein